MKPDDFLKEASAVPYRPQATPTSGEIALVGCGGITKHHLEAYRRGGLNVTAFYDVDRQRAESQRNTYFPEAAVCESLDEVLQRNAIQVVDIATHPPERPALIEAALRAGKHVLSQKPFVTDLLVGSRLCDLADDVDRVLAVNQNARWAPHFAYAIGAIRRGLLGRVMGAHLSVHWDHSWVAGSPFETVPHLLLYDYAIHWFDMLTCLIEEPPLRVYASTATTQSQSIENPLLAQVSVEYEHAQATLAFDANTPHGAQDRTFISGEQATIRSTGPGNSEQSLVIDRGDSQYAPQLSGRWFPDAFLGTMSETLTAIESGTSPSINGRDNLNSLALCFAAVESAKRRQPIEVGGVHRLPD